MRLSIGSFLLDGAAASSTITSASFRLDYERPFAPGIRGNEMRIEGLRAYIEAASEAALKTALETLETNFDQASGKTITYYNTTGTALFVIDPADWPEVEIERVIDHSDRNAVVVFNIAARRDEPVSGGAADVEGQRGEIFWEPEIGANGLTGLMATCEFGPSSSNSAWENAAAWVADLFKEPPTGLPSFVSGNLRAVHASPVITQMPNQASITDDSYSNAIVSVLFRENYSGLPIPPESVVDLNVNATMVNSDMMDVRSGESVGPALITLSGWFTIKTEAPTAFNTGATKVARGAIYEKALATYGFIENDFRNVYSRFPLEVLGDPTIDVALDSGRTTFARVFSTTRMLKFDENTEINNVDPVVFNRTYRGKDIVHHGQGGPIATLHHNLYIESLDPQPYKPPTLDSNWVRMDKSQNVQITAQIRGGTLVFITRGSSNWRYANPSERGPSDLSTQGGSRIVTMDSIGDGAL